MRRSSCKLHFCIYVQFRTCLGTLNFKLTQNEIDELIARYKVGNSGLINYSAFISNINSVFSDTANPSEVIHNVKSQAVRVTLLI